MKNYIWIKAFVFVALCILFFKAVTDFTGFKILLDAVFKFISPFTIAFIIAYLLYPFVLLINAKVFLRLRFIKSPRICYTLSVLVAYVSLTCVTFVIIQALIPQLRPFINSISSMKFDALYLQLERNWQYIQQQFGLFTQLPFATLLQNIIAFSRNFLNPLTLMDYLDNIIGFSSTLFTLFLAFFLSLYMLLERDTLFQTIRKVFYLFMTEESQQKVVQYIKKSNTIFIKFFWGKACNSLIIGIISTIGFYFLNVPLFGAMGSIVMVFNMIPYFGPFIGAIPVLLITLINTGDIMSTLWVALFILAVQQFDGLYLGPKMMGDSVGLSVFWILTSITIGGASFGFIGLLLCVPTAAVIKTIFNDYYALMLRRRTQKMIIKKSLGQKPEK